MEVVFLDSVNFFVVNGVCRFCLHVRPLRWQTGTLLVDVLDIFDLAWYFFFYQFGVISAEKRDRSGGCLFTFCGLVGGLLAYCMAGDAGTVGTDGDTDGGGL